ncbi:MAG: formylglycine-generating enzyme family protein [Mariprofundaceae bacterium]|nr:formylglycine-generating enzyme family protein [Mariprofundaceae bacterium]
MKKLQLLLGLFALQLLPCMVYASDKNPIGMDFVEIPAGSFHIGSCALTQKQSDDNKKAVTKGEKTIELLCVHGEKADKFAFFDEAPQHEVNISKPFEMAIHEVTLAQFKAFMREAKRNDLNTDTFKEYNDFGDQAAVVWVSWKEAQEYISWLNEGNKGKKYRLPTEAEWEYAARAGTTTLFSFGDDVEKIKDYAWFDSNAGKIRPVGQKKPNPWGLYDMHGNAWEWVQDWYGAGYYAIAPTVDPQGPEKGVLRGNRGGSWNYFAAHLRSANRSYNSEEYHNLDLGFRLVRQ